MRTRAATEPEWALPGYLEEAERIVAPALIEAPWLAAALRVE